MDCTVRGKVCPTKSFSTDLDSIETIGIMNATNIKIKSGAINKRALIFCCRRERFRLFFNGVPSADKSTFEEELLTIKVSFAVLVYWAISILDEEP